MQPVSLRSGRGVARLSFLGGRSRKDSAPQPQVNGDHAPQQPNGDSHHHQQQEPTERSRSKDNTNRLSFFRSHSSDKPQANGQGYDSSGGPAGMDWVTDSGPRESTDGTTLDREKATLEGTGTGGGGVVKMGSVRKRLSLLKLGRKASKGNDLMVAVDEE